MIPANTKCPLVYVKYEPIPASRRHGTCDVEELAIYSDKEATKLIERRPWYYRLGFFSEYLMIHNKRHYVSWLVDPRTTLNQPI